MKKLPLLILLFIILAAQIIAAQNTKESKALSSQAYQTKTDIIESEMGKNQTSDVKEPPQQMNECERFKMEISNLKRSYEIADEATKKEIASKISYYEEKLKSCMPGSIEEANVAAQAAIIEKCQEIEKEMRELAMKFQNMNEEEKRQAMEKMTELKNNYVSCIGRPQVSPKPVVPFDPCEEARILEKLSATVQQKYNDALALYQEGKMSKEEFQKQKIEMENYNKRLESAQQRCQGNMTKENPCIKFDTLEKIYVNLKMQLEMTKDEGERSLLNEKLNSLAKDMDYARAECNKNLTSAEGITSIEEVQKAIEAKSKIILQKVLEENKTDRELADELAKIEQERARLIKEFVEKMKELDARKQTIINTIKIGKNVSVENIEVNATRVMLEVNGKSIEVIPGEKVEIKQENITVISDPLEYINGTLYASKSGAEIKILPAQLKEKIRERERIKKINMKDEAKPVYEVTAEKQGHLLWIIPTNIEISYKIDATNGQVIEEKGPWFGILVR